MHISHNAPYLPPQRFSWDGCNTQDKWKVKVVQSFGGQIRCIMGDVQVAKFYHLFAPAPPKYHVTLRACKDGGYREKRSDARKNFKSNFSEAAEKHFQEFALAMRFCQTHFFIIGYLDFKHSISCFLYQIT